MKRLTTRHYDGTGVEVASNWDALEKLARYEDAEEQGRLVVLPEPTPDIDFMRIFNLIMADADGRVFVLPCKVGDMVYEITPRHTINTMYVDRFEIRRGEIGAILILTDGYRWSPCDHKICEIGKTVFLSREEAEKALEGIG